MIRLTPAAALLALGMLTSGCVVEPVNPYPPPPAPRVEVLPPPPGPAFVWEPGHYHWNGAAYVWLPGRYVTRIAGTTHWEHGHWANRGGAWVWIPGHWV
jgi:hypothetical protein